MTIAHHPLPCRHHVAERGWARPVHTWRSAEPLRETSLLLPQGGGPPQGCAGLAQARSSAEDGRLLVREAAAWARHGGDAAAPEARS